MENMSLQLKSILTLSAVFLLIAFVTCNNGKTELEMANATRGYSSVSMENGTYKIDSAIAESNGNKLKLLPTLENEKLSEKKNVNEIPGFIKAFLDSISTNKTFDMADPGTEWQTGGWINGFDDQQKNIVNAVSSVAKPFSNKQLIYFGLGKNMALLSYYTGGIQMTQHIAIIKFKDTHIIDLWFGNNSFDYDWLNGRSVFVTTKNEIIKYLRTSRSGNC